MAGGDRDLTLDDAAAGAVSARLQRIGELDRRGAPPAELLPELRRLLSDAAQSGRADAEGREVVGRLRTALHRT